MKSLGLGGGGVKIWDGWEAGNGTIFFFFLPNDHKLCRKLSVNGNPFDISLSVDCLNLKTNDTCMLNKLLHLQLHYLYEV